MSIRTYSRMYFDYRFHAVVIFEFIFTYDLRYDYSSDRLENKSFCQKKI